MNCRMKQSPITRVSLRKGEYDVELYPLFLFLLVFDFC